MPRHGPSGPGEARPSGPGSRSIPAGCPSNIDKGTVVRRLADGCTAACYLGDDLGDLPAFAALATMADESGMATVSVAVVDEESDPAVEAAADVTVEGPREGLGLLRWLAEAAAPEDGP
jgi:trehalose 6-phosphate phosphatase